MIWYPICYLRQFPMFIAKHLGIITSQYRWFAVAYVLFFFLLFPLTILGLSLAGVWVLVGVGVPILVLIIVVVVINVLQYYRPNWLPSSKNIDLELIRNSQLDTHRRCIKKTVNYN